MDDEISFKWEENCKTSTPNSAGEVKQPGNGTKIDLRGNMFNLSSLKAPET